jgi:hypothetical protein
MHFQLQTQSSVDWRHAVKILVLSLSNNKLDRLVSPFDIPLPAIYAQLCGVDLIKEL